VTAISRRLASVRWPAHPFKFQRVAGRVGRNHDLAAIPKITLRFLAGVNVHAAVNRANGIAFVREPFFEVVEGVAVFREDDELFFFLTNHA
jgi:hypothetical protein